MREEKQRRLRAFVAIELPQRVKHVAAELQAGLQAQGVRLRWVRPENMHLTLQFLGDIDPNRVPEITTGIECAVRQVPSFSLAAGRVGVFPNRRKPRVVWMGMGGEVDRLAQLQLRVTEALAQIGFPPERRPFKGHLTLGRTRGNIDARLLQDALSKVAPNTPGAFVVESISFFKSELRPTGAVYSRLTEIALK